MPDDIVILRREQRGQIVTYYGAKDGRKLPFGMQLFAGDLIGRTDADIELMVIRGIKSHADADETR